MKVSYLLIGVVTVASLFGGGWYVGKEYPDLISTGDLLGKNETDDAPTVKLADKVVAQGRIVPAGGVRNIFALPGGQIQRLLVKEGETVVRGKTELATLVHQQTLSLQAKVAKSKKSDAAREIQQRILAADSRVKAAQAALQNAILQQALAQDSTDLSYLDNEIKLAAEKLKSLTALSEDQETRIYVSKFQLNQQQISIESAKAKLSNAQKKADQLLKSTTLAVKINEESLKTAKASSELLARLQGNQQSLDLGIQIADQQLQDSRLFSPIDGTVLNVLTNPGDTIGSNPILQIASLDQLECVAEVVDRLSGRVKIGQTVKLSSPALSTSLSGKVIEIGKTVGPGQLVNPNPLAAVDRRSVKVRILIDAKDAAKAKSLIFLQVDVEIETPTTKN